MKGELLISSIVFLPKFGKLLLFLMSTVLSVALPFVSNYYNFIPEFFR